MIERILDARVYDVARETPLDPARRLGARLGCPVLLKREDLQPVFSFKLRGAYNRMSRLAPREVERGVIAASAGNHSQGVALAASRLGLRARIVMPVTTPRIKVDAVTDLGADVVIHGDTYDDAEVRARAEAEAEGLPLIHPYDDLDVIAGQGTIGVEVLRQHPDPIEAIFVPVGGGGLIAGIASYVKFLRPETQVIGVEPEDSACLHAALEQGRRVVLDSVGIFADGVAVRQVGREPWRLVQGRVDGVVRVNTDAICGAILDIFEDTRTMAEPSGALAVAGLKQHLEDHGGSGATRVAIVSGANINFHRLRHISERAELGQHREAILGVTIPERPGSFRAFCSSLGDLSITEFNYRYADPEAAHVFVGIELRDGAPEKAEAFARLRKGGYAVVDMSDNETAKLHARHLVGGRAPGVTDERVFRFEFPERPGALGRFLDEMAADWNITLFHYRNHGAARGRVLVGLQVPRADDRRFAGFLSGLDLPCVEETENPAYRLFLAGD
jgi:threonine dehydratase